MGRNEDEVGLRDAVALTAPGDDPGPAGRVFLATKRLSTRKPAFSTKAVAELADLLELAWDGRLATAVDHADDALQSGSPAPLAAADLVTAVHAMRPDAELLAWMLADMLITAQLKWDFAVPLRMAKRYGPAFKTLGGRGRVRPGRHPGPARHGCLGRLGARQQALALGGRPGCSTGWKALARCVNFPVALRSEAMGCDNERTGGSQTTAWQRAYWASERGR